jgi:hypothetical protein
MTTKRITEMGVTFYRAGGHKHDGITSSLIDTSKYSLFDFDLSLSTDGADNTRELTRQANKNRFNQYVGNFVATQVLAPAGIVLPVDYVRGVNIGADEITAQNILANTITANEIAANTITANEIAVGTITSNLLVTDFAVVNSTIRSNNFTYNANTGVGTGWAIYGNGSAVFVDGTFSGEIDIGGFDNTSFHVDASGNMWSGSANYANGKFKVSSLGDVVITGTLNAGTSLGTAAYFAGAISVDGPGFFYGFENRMKGEIKAGYFTSNLIDTNPLIYLKTGIGGNLGRTELIVRRTLGVNNSSWDNQILKLVNESAPDGSPQMTCGISFGVGRLGGDIFGVVLRQFPGSGGGSEYISGISVDQDGINYDVRPDPNPPGNPTAGAGGISGGGENGLDVGNYAGTGYGYIGAASFVIRSSQTIKDNIEYMPPESRDISVERIRNLKPVRWDDKAKLSYGVPGKRFVDINEKWVARGRRPLEIDWKHYETVEHICELENCIGNESNPCPPVGFHKNRYGFVAEDVAEVFPKAVQFSTLGKPIGIDYAVISYALVETSQHLLDKIEELENKIAELSAQ